ncbi:hypothetical protein Tco_1016691 [Tanacetum coccineum]|uniref:F-box associated domain-containing protein n=1 Tax=Tanacetum coccineum TaxID=301880 RepID=A0ABQ5FPD0_9ASTR
MKTMEKDDKAAGEILEVTPSLELCTVIPRASKNLKKVVEAKFFKFVIQRDKGKEEMFRVYVEKKARFSKLVDKRLFVVHHVKKKKRFEVPIALRGEDDSFALVHTGKDHLILHLWESGMEPVGCQVMNLIDYYRTGSMCWVDHGVDQVDRPFSLNVNDTCSYWFVGSRYMVELDGGSM